MLHLKDSHEQINIEGSLSSSMSKFPTIQKIFLDIKFLHGTPYSTMYTIYNLLTSLSTDPDHTQFSFSFRFTQSSIVCLHSKTVKYFSCLHKSHIFPNFSGHNIVTNPGQVFTVFYDSLLNQNTSLVVSLPFGCLQSTHCFPTSLTSS